MHACLQSTVCLWLRAVIRILTSCEELQRLGLQGPQVPWQASHRIRGEPPVLSSLIWTQVWSGLQAT
jgi:hypothetical protein